MSTWKDPNGNTPSIVQTDFGSWGQLVPGDGWTYCGPTALVMGLYYLYNNGFTQLAPGPFIITQDQDNKDTVNLELIIAGLLATSVPEGTNGVEFGIATYLSACGIPPSQYTYSYRSGTYTVPCTLQWLSDALAPNVTPGANSIVLADFYVAWYGPADLSKPLVLTSNGGHVLCPLTVDTTGNTITLNNPWPPSFEKDQWSPSDNPQTVKIVPVPAKYTLKTPDTGGGFSWVVSGTQGHDHSFAVVNGADIFTISNAVLPANGYVPATWEIPDAINQSSKMQAIDTNGGTLKVLAPLAGAGGLYKGGEGQLLLTNTNALTGWLMVNGGSVASQLTTGTPFGLGPIILGSGGTLVLSPGASTLAVEIASGAKYSTLAVEAGGGVLQLQSTGLATVTIGGYTDAATSNLTRTAAGTLILQPSQGLAILGGGQNVVVAGSVDNLPNVSNGMVAPWIVGQDNDEAGSGAFLNYGSSGFDGFLTAKVYMSDATDINLATSDMIYQVNPDSAQTINTGDTVTVAALEMDGGSIDATGAFLQIGGQTAADFAGLILNGGPISGGTLSFGASEAVVYASANSSPGNTISSTVSGTGGLTLCGPGELVLQADNSTTLSGPVNLNSGTLTAAGPNSATGSGAITVNSNATLWVSGAVSGAVTVGQSGTLLLDGGTVSGDVTIAAVGESTSLPGGALQGSGTLSGTVVAAGNILPGATPGFMAFSGTVSLPGGGAFTIQPQGLIDNTTKGQPGVDWNALQIGQKTSITIGDSQPWSPYVDFSQMGGDPDAGNAFWNTARQWTVITFQYAVLSYYYCPPANAYYSAGDFDMSWKATDPYNFYLTWTPAEKKRTPAELFALRARARPRRTMQRRKTP